MFRIEPDCLPAIVPAAGDSSRLGESKQLLEYDGEALVSRCVRALRASGAEPLVILGACAGRIRSVLPPGTQRVVNRDWRLGLGASIACGVRTLPRHSEAVLIALPDQPLVGADRFTQLIERWRQNPDYVVCAAYGDTRGAPAILPCRHFDALIRLQGDRGAGDLIRAETRIVTIAMPEAVRDVDVPEDRAALGLQSPS